jgi:hypothetical protein
VESTRLSLLIKSHLPGYQARKQALLEERDVQKTASVLIYLKKNQSFEIERTSPQNRKI